MVKSKKYKLLKYNKKNYKGGGLINELFGSTSFIKQKENTISDYKIQNQKIKNSITNKSFKPTKAKKLSDIKAYDITNPENLLKVYAGKSLLHSVGLPISAGFALIFILTNEIIAIYDKHFAIKALLIELTEIFVNCYKLNELIEKINKVIAIFIFNKDEYIKEYKTLYKYEKRIFEGTSKNINNNINKENNIYDKLYKTAFKNKDEIKENIMKKGLSTHDMSSIISIDVNIINLLAEKIGLLINYMLSISTDSLLEKLLMNNQVIKSGLLNIIKDEIESRKNKSSLVKYYIDFKKTFYRSAFAYTIEDKIEKQLITINTLFMLMKSQYDFIVDFYKSQNDGDEWNKLWKLITLSKEYTSYMIPEELFHTTNEIIKTEIENTVEMKKATDMVSDIIELEEKVKLAESNNNLHTKKSHMKSMRKSKSKSKKMSKKLY
jgi:hypothetical protein